tara:strand:+ start:1512 stop:2570 length:1059 start_codon:yes stop_codon:yes gene_type:complete
MKSNNKKRIALITGINGQDGSYLAEFLLEKGYEIHGIIRRSSIINTSRLDEMYEDLQKKEKKFFLHYGDLTDGIGINKLIKDIEPDEIYNLAAQSHVSVSFDIPEYTANVDSLGTLRILEAVLTSNLVSKTKIYQASTSELYGKVFETPQSETTPFYPRSPYGVSKLFAYWIIINYREAYKMHASNGILFNHESPRRGETFVTRKITRAVARIKLGLQNKLFIGNLNAKRDWGHAKDYVEMMWLMLQQKQPDDYVISTGRTESVRFFAESAFREIGIDLIWKGEGKEEKGICKKTGNVYVEVDANYFRPTEVDVLKGDSSKAQKILGWKPKFSLEELISEMVESDIRLFSKG